METLSISPPRWPVYSSAYLCPDLLVASFTSVNPVKSLCGQERGGFLILVAFKTHDALFHRDYGWLHRLFRCPHFSPNSVLSFLIFTHTSHWRVTGTIASTVNRSGVGYSVHDCRNTLLCGWNGLQEKCLCLLVCVRGSAAGVYYILI